MAGNEAEPSKTEMMLRGILSWCFTVMRETVMNQVEAPPSPKELRDRFQRLTKEWKEQSRYLSNSAQIAMLDSYQRIIGMGWQALPLILEEMKKEPGQWFWALEAITEENPVPPESAGRILEMTQAWIDWAKKRGIIAT